MPNKADILAECVDAILAGHEPDEILDRYPDYAEEISRLTQTVRVVRAASHSFQVLARPESPLTEQPWA